MHADRHAGRIACIGECMIELSEQPDGSFTRRFGGDTLNTAIYLARLGEAVDYVTALGRDPFSEAMLAAWQAEGIGTALVQRCDDALPGLYMIQTDSSGERRFSYWRDSAPVRRMFALPGMAAVEAALAGHGVIYLSGISLSLFGADRARLFALLDRLRAGGATVAFDTNFRPRGWPDLATARSAMADMLRRADIVLGSVEDHALLDGATETAAVITRLQACAPSAEIVVKLAEPGCVVCVAGARHEVATLRIEAVDTTAAGDSFAAAYLAARRSGLDPLAAARCGHRLAKAVVCHRGAIMPREAMPGNILAPPERTTS